VSVDDLVIRTYEAADEDAVLKLLAASLGGGPIGGRSAAFFRWKHLENPFGRSLMLVARRGDEIVGLRAFMRWRFSFAGQAITAVRAVDTATHPSQQGKGIFRRLTLEALDRLRGDTDLVFNTPNDKSMPGYLKMGWTRVGRVPIRVRIRRPLRFLRRARSYRSEPDDRPTFEVDAPRVGELLDDVAWPDTLARVNAANDVINTDRSREYVRWRYAAAPGLDYRAIDEGDALVIFRVRPRGSLREATVAELFVAGDAVGAGARLLRGVARTADVDHVTCSFPSGSPAGRASSRAGFVRVPGGPTLVTNPLRSVPSLQPTEPSSWGLTLGDVEVF
jgi:GNAT superfamily N-acetyltransferase